MKVKAASAELSSCFHGQSCCGEWTALGLCCPGWLSGHCPVSGKSWPLTASLDLMVITAAVILGEVVSSSWTFHQGGSQTTIPTLAGTDCPYGLIAGSPHSSGSPTRQGSKCGQFRKVQ